MPDTTPLLRAESVDKAFGGVPALRGASLEVARGEVHALVGENGAGKSTLIKIITGVHRGDAGTVTFDGEPLEVRSPQQAQERGISTIYQEINLVPMRSVAENVAMGREPRRLGLIDWKKMNAEARTTLARLGLQDLDVTRTLKEDGVSTIFVSHRLDELYAVCDRVTIMRDGETVRTSTMGDITKLQLIADMLGK